MPPAFALRYPPPGYPIGKLCQNKTDQFFKILLPLLRFRTQGKVNTVTRLTQILVGTAGLGVCLYRQRKSGSAVEFQKPRRGICICQKPQRRSVKFTRHNILSDPDPQPYTDRGIERERPGIRGSLTSRRRTLSCPCKTLTLFLSSCAIYVYSHFRTHVFFSIYNQYNLCLYQLYSSDLGLILSNSCMLSCYSKFIVYM